MGALWMRRGRKIVKIYFWSNARHVLGHHNSTADCSISLKFGDRMTSPIHWKLSRSKDQKVKTQVTACRSVSAVKCYVRNG